MEDVARLERKAQQLRADQARVDAEIYQSQRVQSRASRRFDEVRAEIGRERDTLHRELEGSHTSYRARAVMDFRLGRLKDQHTRSQQLQKVIDQEAGRQLNLSKTSARLDALTEKLKERIGRQVRVERGRADDRQQEELAVLKVAHIRTHARTVTKESAPSSPRPLHLPALPRPHPVHATLLGIPRAVADKIQPYESVKMDRAERVRSLKEERDHLRGVCFEIERPRENIEERTDGRVSEAGAMNDAPAYQSQLPQSDMSAHSASRAAVSQGSSYGQVSSQVGTSEAVSETRAVAATPQYAVELLKSWKNDSGAGLCLELRGEAGNGVLSLSRDERGKVSVTLRGVGGKQGVSARTIRTALADAGFDVRDVDIAAAEGAAVFAKDNPL